MEHEYCALIVDGNLEHRARLRFAMRASLLFPTVHVANSLEEAEHHLSEEPIDIVFIAMREDGDVVNRFIKRLKQELAGRDAAYVLLLEGRRNSVEIARTLVDGADALLLEPYSVESLHTISRLAEKMKKERSRVRMQVPLRLLVREIAAQLGQVARLEKSGASALVSRGVLQGNVFRARRIGPRNAFALLRGNPGCLPANPRNSRLAARPHLSGRKPAGAE